MLRYAAAALAAFLLSAPVQAAEGCRPIEAFVALVEANHLTPTVYSDAGTVAKAVAYYNAQPGLQIESADAIIVVRKPGGILVVFTHGDQACEVLRTEQPQLVDDFETSVLGRAS